MRILYDAGDDDDNGNEDGDRNDDDDYVDTNITNNSEEKVGVK